MEIQLKVVDGFRIFFQKQGSDTLKFRSVLIYGREQESRKNLQFLKIKFIKKFHLTEKV